MSQTPYTWRSATLRDIDTYWQELELRLDQMGAREHQLNIMYEIAEDKNKPNIGERILNQQAEIKRVLELQSEVEMFLIENEAEGWTST